MNRHADARTGSGPSVVHVGFGVDADYAPHAAVAAASVLAVHPDAEVHLHVAFTDLDASIVGRFEAVASRPDHHVHVHRTEGHGLPGFARFSDAVHLRFALPDLVPDDCRRILYLDADVVVATPLTPLFEMDLGDATLAAAVDDTWRWQVRRLEERALETYVNAGVLLIDVGRWRERDATRRLTRFIREEGPSLMMPDQDAVNIVLGDELKLLDRRWNVQRPTFFGAARDLGLDPHAHRALVQRPGIVHYTEWSKPWHPGDQHPLGALYRRLRARTPFRDPGIEAGRSTRTRIRTWIRRVLLRIHPDAHALVESIVERLRGRAGDPDD